MENEQDLQRQIDELKRRLDNLDAVSTIPFEIDKAFNARGFLKEDFFVAGIGTFNVAGEYRQVIPGADNRSIILATGAETAVSATFGPGYNSTDFGGSSSRFDITNPSGDTFRYTWDGTGTNPNINQYTLPIDSRVVIFSSNFNVANQNTALRPYFIVTGSGSNYFEVTNTTPGVAENDVTIGTGVINGGAPNDNREMICYGSANETFYFVVFLFNKLFTDLQN